MKYRLSRRAENDVEAIGDHIAADSPAAAARVIRDFVRRWQLLAMQPFSGQSAEEFGPETRRLVMGRYLAFYKVTPQELLILRVLHGSRDITPGEFDD